MQSTCTQHAMSLWRGSRLSMAHTYVACGAYVVHMWCRYTGMVTGTQVQVGWVEHMDPKADLALTWLDLT